MAAKAKPTKTDKKPSGNGFVPRLKARYRDELRGQLLEDLGLKNIMEVPRPVKVVVNMGVGEAPRDAKIMDGAVKDLTIITGQKPAVRRARKSLATFKLRAGMPIGAATTIRGDRMWDFLDRLLSVVLPRIRDFRGLNPKSFDGAGNYTFGVNEQLVFPEVDYDDIDMTRGMDITIVTTAKDDESGVALLAALGFPFGQPRTEG
jgi:large subunit ribosomal protein L5